MFKRMGELLVECGELTEGQLAGILAEQRRSYQPFGQIASKQFGVPIAAVWHAWARQYASFCPRVELSGEPRDCEALANVNATSAWNHRLLPLRWHDGDLIMVTCPDRLARALQFVDEHIDAPTLIWLTDSIHALEDALRIAYPNCDRQTPARRRAPRVDVA